MNKNIVGLICVSPNDVAYLFDYALVSALRNIHFISHLYIVTPDPNVVKNRLNQLQLQTPIKIDVVSDSVLFSKEELELCGWSRQQIIKLRSYRLNPGSDILNIGADTIILQKLVLDDVCDPNVLIVNFRNHTTRDKHYDFEIERCRNIANLLGITVPNELMRDYIFDVFIFKEQILNKLEDYLYKKFGENYYSKVFPKIVNDYRDTVKTGEWTLYTLFALEILKINYMFRDGSRLVHQIHSQKDFSNYDYSDKAIHFVRKDFDKGIISEKIRYSIPKQ